MMMGAPTWPPNPPTLEPPRPSRGGSRQRDMHGGPDMAPKPPNARATPAKPWGLSTTRHTWGPRRGPEPQRPSHPGEAVGLSTRLLAGSALDDFEVIADVDGALEAGGGAPGHGVGGGGGGGGGGRGGGG